MLGMFLNRRDADAVSYDAHLETMRGMEEVHRINMDSIEYLGDLDNAKRIIERQRQETNRERVIANAYSRTLGDLANMADPATRELVRYRISRFLDAEITASINAGYLTDDPRHDQAWRQGVNYRPSR